MSRHSAMLKVCQLANTITILLEAILITPVDLQTETGWEQCLLCTIATTVAALSFRLSMGTLGQL